ncbi:MAG TPA: FG-GAP-like repeat-containing protein [Candidatus Acidoferrales bacterium]|jgi:Flp pilus assembly protein TadD|nr:FG-GAP-like repeat-containing protein [Candidatus Acidoferrales bacterium]
MPRLLRLSRASAALLGVLACVVFAHGQAGKRPYPYTPAAKSARKSPEAPASAPAPPLPFPYTEALRADNIGLALMDSHQFDQALGKFQTACILDSQSDVGCLNTGMAFLYMRRYDDARRILDTSTQRDPQSARAWFNFALLERAAGNMDAALADFEKVAALDPDDPDTQYFLGFLDAQAGRTEKARAEFQRAIALDPFHASAEFGLAQLEQDSGDAAGAKAHLERFRHITAQGLGKPVEFVYGAQGKYSLAGEIPGPPPGPAPPEIPVRFVDISGHLGLPQPPFVPAPAARPRGKAKSPLPPAAPVSLAKFLGSGACVFDFDGDGKPDIFLVNADGNGNAALLHNVGHGRFVDVTKAAKLQFLGEGTGCAVGDYDNDGHPDLVVSSADGITLFHNEGDGTFRDVTDAAGVRTIGLALGVTFIDYDRDGDLDIYVTRFNDFPLANPAQPFTFPDGAMPPGNVLWRNLGGGTFADYTKQTALGGSAASVGALESDLNDDGSTDLVVTGWDNSPEVFLNAREGPFQSAAPWTGAAPRRTAGAASLDFDHDGATDLAFTHWAPPVLSLWRNTSARKANGPVSFERVPLPDPGWMRAWGVAAVDYDNDGWTDLVAVGETFAGKGKIVLLRNEGVGPNGKVRFRDVTHETGLDKIALRDPRSVIAFDPEVDGSPDLLITQNGLPPVLLKNIGGNDNSWLQLSLAGDADNRTGIGARAEILSGARKFFLEVPGASGYLGQSPAEIFTGLGSEEDAADVVRVRWPTGARQNVIHVPGNQPSTIAEQPK